jgi:hypothetical protein
MLQYYMVLLLSDSNIICNDPEKSLAIYTALLPQKN